MALFEGTVLVVAPHMDDETLACGGLLALLPDKSRIHMAFATDGMKSPAPVLPWRDFITPDLGSVRESESRAAAALLGVPVDHLHFLRLPEAELPSHYSDLARGLERVIRDVSPDHVLVPFRYDRHTDHLAVNSAVRELKRAGALAGTITEYFVYYRSRLLPAGDIRDYVRPEHLIVVDIQSVASLKRKALDCFTTQTTCYYAWQTRPILRPALLDEECAGPEHFLRYDPELPARRIFSRLHWWIPIAQRIEPKLVRWKYLLRSSLQRATGRH